MPTRLIRLPADGGTPAGSVPTERSVCGRS